MDIRVLTYGYNEIKMLPLKKAWCDHHDLTMVYFDNESTDGSREWAIENNVFAGDIITDGAFDIAHIMDEVDKYRQNNKYDWALLAGVDLFLSGIGKLKISEYLKKLPQPSPNGISANCITICRNDGKSTLDFRYYNQYVDHSKEIILIADNSSKLGIDNIQCTTTLKDNDLWWFNMGHTKSVEERKETYERRQLAWSRNLNKGYGNHYRTLANYQFTLPKLVTKSITNTSGSEAYNEMCDLLEKLVY